MYKSINYEREYKSLLDKYVNLIEKKEYSIYIKQPYLEYEYLLKFSELMKEELKIYIHVKQLRKKIDIILSKQKNNENLNDDYDIGFLLKDNLDIDKIFEKSKNSVNLKKASDLEMYEARRIFKLLIRRLHPQVNKNITSAKKKLWKRSKEAYYANDLSTLRMISNIFDHEIECEFIYSIEELKEEIFIISKEIESIEDGFPFNIEKDIDNSSWVVECKNVIRERIKKLKEDELNLTNILNDLK
ncbi:hypothetical protein CHF27_007950 [Romboutsia maritimum]|uniref:J domain-containing protein n=1 Tax=Romboutsia maritimum TaxID=2020948 RepID=A0A371IST5_9FIRM|nr:hypothetical protein [Romboutsia maritimum]RDY23547.1 hypothetical protein CHF27_007950 [Romboutsia maritimum]